MALYLTPASISFLAQTILFLVITLFLAFISKRSRATYWLTGFYSVFVFTSLASFVSVSSLRWFEYGWHIHNALILVALPLLLQFVYNFPNRNPKRKLESALVTIFSVIFMLLALVVTLVHIFSWPVIDQYPFLPRIFQGFQLVEILWAVIILLTLTTKVSSQMKDASWFNRLRHPKGRAARAARGFGLTLLGLFLFWTISLVLDILGYRNWAYFTFTFSTIWALGIFIYTLINQTNQRSGIIIKLVGTILLTTFSGIALASWLAAPVSTANFQAAYAIPNRQTIHFDQNNANYSITQTDFYFQEQLGRNLIFMDGETFSEVKLLTSFAYAGENWDEVFVSPKGYLVFGEKGTQSPYLKTNTAAIAAFYVQDMTVNEEGGVFAHVTEEKTTFTWYASPRLDEPAASITSQIVLYPDASFDITYNGIRTNFIYSAYDIKDFQQITGFFMGANDPNPTRINFNNQLPLISETWTGVYQDYYVDFREYLHQNMSMQLFALVFTSLLLLIVLPIFFQRSFVRPLKTIQEGFKQVIAGNFDTWLEPNFNDDIGQATLEFNQMIDNLALKDSKQNELVNEIKDKLGLRNTELKQAVEKLAAEIELRKSLQEELDNLKQTNTQLSTHDEMLNCYNRQHFLTLAEEEVKRAKRYDHALSFAILDPDYLRMINETYGTLTGDELLKSLTNALQDTLRETDSLGRVGGEEFAVLMPETNGEEALQAANRWRNRIGSLSLETSKGPLRVSISVGVVELPRDGVRSIDVLLHHANQALDQAKAQGRNTAVLWTADLED